MNGYLAALRKYAVFAGRARRREYWGFVGVEVLLVIVLSAVDWASGTYSTSLEGGLLSSLYLLATLVPWLAVTVRRLHDIGRTGWWLPLIFVPVAGLIVLIVFALIDGEVGANVYGPSPKAAGPAAA